MESRPCSSWDGRHTPGRRGYLSPTRADRSRWSVRISHTNQGVEAQHPCGVRRPSAATHCHCSSFPVWATVLRSDYGQLSIAQMLRSTMGEPAAAMLLSSVVKG